MKPVEMDVIPDIKCGSAINGVVHITIRNIDLFWETEPLYQWEDLCFKVSYRNVTSAPSTNSNTSHREIDAMWRNKYILFANVPDDGELYFKVSTYLNDYDLEFKIAAFNLETSKWMTPCEVFTVNIPSFLTNNEFTIGERVSFRDAQSSYTSTGTIIQTIDGNNYRVQDMQGNEYDINISRLYHDAIRNEFQCNLQNKHSLHKQLLMKRNDDTVNVFHALCESFEELSIEFCVEIYGVMNATINWEAMCQFIATNVFQFLYEAQFEYIVDCLLDGVNHHGLEMMNILQHDIKIKYEYTKRDKSKDYNTASITWSCDWCRSEMGPWEYGFRCVDCKFEDRHEFCAFCVNTIINLNGELIELLSDLLSDELITDVTQTIVDFVIGRVIIKELKHNENHSVNNVDKKRKTNDECYAVAPKRRKLN